MYSFYVGYLITTSPFPPGAPAALAFGAGTPQPPAPPDPFAAPQLGPEFCECPRPPPPVPPGAGLVVIVV